MEPRTVRALRIFRTVQPIADLLSHTAPLGPGSPVASGKEAERDTSTSNHPLPPFPGRAQPEPGIQVIDLNS